jgi:hypothetical protein
MRLLTGILTLAIALPIAGLAQNWEVGASGGYGISRDLNVSGQTITGNTGLKPGYAFGALLGNDVTKRIGGEIRYTYRKDDLKVSSGSVEATARGESHALHYDVLIHATERGSPVRPYLAVGAGARLFRGTGAETAFQPLSNLVVLTHTTQTVPLVSAGAGVKFAISPRVMFRLDARDYATPSPDLLLASPVSGRVHGWIHDVVFLVGISTSF